MVYTEKVIDCGLEDKDHDQNVNIFLAVARKYNLTFNKNQNIVKGNQSRLLGFEIMKGEIKPDPDRLQSLKDLQPPTIIQPWRLQLSEYSFDFIDQTRKIKL